jgi:hypothetical protein
MKPNDMRRLRVALLHDFICVSTDGIGIADMIVSAMQLDGATVSEARDRIYEPEYRQV